MARWYINRKNWSVLYSRRKPRSTIESINAITANVNDALFIPNKLRYALGFSDIEQLISKKTLQI